MSQAADSLCMRKGRKLTVEERRGHQETLTLLGRLVVEGSRELQLQKHFVLLSA